MADDEEPQRAPQAPLAEPTRLPSAAEPLSQSCSADASPSAPVTECPADALPSTSVTECPADASPSAPVTECPVDASPPDLVTEGPADASPPDSVTKGPADASVPEQVCEGAHAPVWDDVTMAAPHVVESHLWDFFYGDREDLFSIRAVPAHGGAAHIAATEGLPALPSQEDPPAPKPQEEEVQEDPPAPKPQQEVQEDPSPTCDAMTKEGPSSTCEVGTQVDASSFERPGPRERAQHPRSPGDFAPLGVLLKPQPLVALVDSHLWERLYWLSLSDILQRLVLRLFVAKGLSSTTACSQVPPPDACSQVPPPVACSPAPPCRPNLSPEPGPNGLAPGRRFRASAARLSLLVCLISKTLHSLNHQMSSFPSALQPVHSSPASLLPHAIPATVLLHILVPVPTHHLSHFVSTLWTQLRSSSGSFSQCSCVLSAVALRTTVPVCLLNLHHLQSPRTEVDVRHEAVSRPEETPKAESGDNKSRKDETLHKTTDTNDSAEVINLQGKQNLEEEGQKQQTNLESLLEDLGLKEQYHREKLSLSKILQIDEKTMTDDPGTCKANASLCFLKKLMMVNVTARTVNPPADSNCFDASETTDYNFDDLSDSPNDAEVFNPLDIITALFLCSDGFVQQELALKMSMCQFSVPLLLPNCDTKQCTLMLWAMRDIVKKYRPPDLSESKGFKEERIVLSELPMISFVRLGECSLSKSEILNKLLSNPQQYHDTFVHHNMECGDSPRKISDGLTEITWYLPCGNKNMDIFSEPVAIANLRGDIAAHETQFSFLCQTSAAVFVFFDQLESKCKLLTNKNHKAKIFLVGNQKSKSFNLDVLKKIADKLNLKKNIIIKTKQTNDADFVKRLRTTVSSVLTNPVTKMSIEQMTDIAHELGISVDEDSPECQAGRKNADAITAEIKDTFKFKEKQFPLQGQIWKELTFLEKEEFRLRKVGSEDIENYKSNLKMKKQELRRKQNSHAMSNFMSRFISAISSKERGYFLKWMRMNLDNLSRIKLSSLRELYKEKCKDSENKNEIKEIDQQLSSSSLGIEHFFREMGQIYEASLYLPETDPSRQQLQHLPKLYAQLLLDGFPLELVDGDASNIPLRWVSDVLSQLNDLVSPKNKIVVVTVLGVQSTGKSTLLNTMFGVQFAVSSGRCTRGAFMLLIKVSEDFKKDLNCDFVVIIDTEGLKSPELAQLDNSHEHDNELATLVVGLSDVTIINIAMENSTEMKDILQIVVHAFLRMKEVGKKPKCQFVHQNVSDVSAHEKNLRDRKLLLEQLNEMTQAAAKMEKKEENKNFTDVMEYNPDTGNCYIPGLWNGNPPMAPVNVGYSETVYELKKNIIQLLGKCESTSNDILEFREWINSLWTAVKHENFIFSFRNSLVADAYMRLCTEYNKWEWEFKKEMYTWVTNAETRISNVGTVAAKTEISNLREYMTLLKSEGTTELTKWESKMLDNLKKYFEQPEGHVYLVEEYREDFSNSIKSLRKQTESSVFNQITAAADIKQGLKELDKIRDTYIQEIETAVGALIDECRKKKVKMTDGELDESFNKMWAETLNTLSFSAQQTSNIFTSVSLQLRTNLSHKGGHACELLSERKLQDCGLEPFTYKPKGKKETIEHTFSRFLPWKDAVKAKQEIAESIISACDDCVGDKVMRKTNYHDTYIQEILHIIDERLNKTDVYKDIEFEVSLKQHICGSAAREFQKMHEDFLEKHDPYRRLHKNKDKFCADFKDVFHERDQCLKKAEEFTNQCLEPAVEDFVYRSLGLDIVDKMLTREEFSTRMSFQYYILLDLISKSDFQSFQIYSCSYEHYVKSWISDRIKEVFSLESTLSEFEDRHLQSIIDHINAAIEKAKAEKTDSLKTFAENICKELGDILVISQDALDAFMVLNKADQDQFAQWLNECVKDMADSLRKKFKKNTFDTKLTQLKVKPQNELFSRVIGCGKQCPFCKVPCDAGGKDHTVHFASLHRPEGLGQYRWDGSEKLMTDICSSAVISDMRFRCSDTKYEWHPYKDYRTIFPAWKIQPDVSLEASDYWKYVMKKYNKEFAEAYHALPADIPDSWKSITEEQAKESLKKSFGIQSLFLSFFFPSKLT
ncbi:interferon-induced very large GTPase 1-like [Fundulus heteroclitus]|uniref:interferon-induced very large GTPase 1-like n=1 Tax=Fundulus heteroclitus TaxID=8078 RepID=UPI00165A93F8|nr:interferon-induced very large GTPase 1-like [Fundulus heteroclitus]